MAKWLYSQAGLLRPPPHFGGVGLRTLGYSLPTLGDSLPTLGLTRVARKTISNSIEENLIYDCMAGWLYSQAGLLRPPPHFKGWVSPL